MKKLLLILILLLSFTLIGNCAWLGGVGDWDYRIEITLPDYAGDIGASVTWFPVEVFLTATQAEEVFAELTNDIEYKKIQFTQADGTSLLYGHMKVFDVAGTKGIFTVSAAGWTIDGNTSIYMYYDKDHIDNDTYIGAINTSACENVYNPQYVAVYTMADGADDEHIYDATSNNNDGTKKDPDQPVEIAGKVGQAQDFDGSDDYIGCGRDSSLNFASAFTLAAIIKRDATGGASEYIVSKYGWTNPLRQYLFYITTTNGFLNVQYGTNSGGTSTVGAEGNIEIDTDWHYVSTTWDKTLDSGKFHLYIDGTETTYTTQNAELGDISTGEAIDFEISRVNEDASAGNVMKGLLDEIRLSSVLRTDAWEKGTYNSLWDDLFTYGRQEPTVGITWNGVVITKWNGVEITIPINTQ